MRSFFNCLGSKEFKTQANLGESKLRGEHPGVDGIQRRLSRAYGKSKRWKVAEQASSTLQIKVASAIETLGRSTAMLLAAEMEVMRVAYAETKSVLHKCLNSMFTYFGSPMCNLTVFSHTLCRLWVV
jgi:hypothetical protein